MTGDSPARVRASRRVGWFAALALTTGYGILALSVNVPKAAEDIHSDEATYYMMGKSLALDGDLAYRRQDLLRVFPEFPHGPSGVFLKEGRDVTGFQLKATPPFFEIVGRPDPERSSRLFFGKSFIYPFVAAPFVRVFGTNGFYLFNSVLMGVALLAAYLFIGARSGTIVTALLSGAFILVSVIPVYVVWMMPEVFNFTLGVLAYFLWLYKYVSPAPSSAATVWLRGPWSDALAAALVGVAAFSKITNGLLIAPIALWWVWQRDWRRTATVVLVFGAFAAGLFAINVGVTGDWNYQGGTRNTFYKTYPFQDATTGFGVGPGTGRDTPLWSVIFDRAMFWTNLGANLKYLAIGRYAGLLPYFCPALAALLAFAFARRRREVWQWFVLGGILAHSLLFIVTQPYTYFGGGGSVGNRYFIGAYGLSVFLFPPVRSLVSAVLPWVVGSVFVGKLVLHPFDSSIRPFNPAKSGPLRLLPVELTNTNDLPINNERSRVQVWYGDNGAGDIAFQVYHLDDNAYLREADGKSVWVRGQSRAEMLFKTDRPCTRVAFTLTAGPVATDVVVTIDGRRQSVHLAPGATTDVRMPSGPGFPYKLYWDQDPKHVWVVSITSSAGFTPRPTADVTDTRYLGVLVKPMMFP